MRWFSKKDSWLNFDKDRHLISTGETPKHFQGQCVHLPLLFPNSGGWYSNDPYLNPSLPQTPTIPVVDSWQFFESPREGWKIFKNKSKSCLLPSLWMLCFSTIIWKGSWRICFRNIAWPKCGGALFLRFVFFWLFFHVYLAALILSIQWCFRILQKHGSMTPNIFVFPCVSVHVKIMSLLLLLVADGSCKSRSIYTTTIITLKSFRRALTAPPAINLLSSRSICRNDFASKFAYDSRTSICFSSSLWFQTNVYPRLTANIFMERWLTTCHVSSNGSLPRKKQNVKLRNPISFLQKQLPFFATCRRA